MADTYNPFGTQATDEGRFFLPPWEDFFQSLSSGSDGGFTTVTNSSVTGTNMTVDSFDISDDMPGAVFYFYMIFRISGGTKYARAGILATYWTDTGAQADNMFEFDVPDNTGAVTTDIYFNFLYSSSSMLLRATCANTYAFYAKRVVVS